MVRGKRILPDPSEIFAIFLRRRWVFLASFFITLIVAAIATITLPQTYTATSALLLEPREAEPVKVNDRGFMAPADDNLIDTAVQVIRSPALTLDVVRKLGLAQSADAHSAGTPAPTQIMREQRAADALLASTSVRRVGVTYLVEISAAATDANRAAKIANAVAERYIELDTSKKQMRNAQSAKYVQNQATALRRQAVADDAALQGYMVRNNLMSAQGATMAEQEVSELNRQIADAQAQVAEQRGKLSAAQSQIARGGGGADIGTALASETVRQLRQQEAQASATLAQLDSRYGARHPDVVQARDELADVRQQLQAELARIVSGLRGEVQIAESRLASLMGSRAHAKSSLAQNGSAQVGRLELERKAEASRAIYNAYLTRAKETAHAGELPNADATIATVARVPNSPSSPNYLLCALIGLAAAAILACSTVAIAEYLEASVASRGQVEGELGAIYAGAVPTLTSATQIKRETMLPQDYVTLRPMSLFTESLRNLAAHLHLTRTGDGPHVVTITSALPREGKSTISMCLARTLALDKHRVVLIDADLRHHSTSSSLFPANRSERLLSVLQGQLPLNEAIIQDEPSGLWVLPTCGPRNVEDVLTEDAFTQLIVQLRQRFDIVIIDSAPALGVAETRMLARISDVTLVAARWRRTPLKAVQTTLDLLRHARAQIGGVVLSQVNIKEFASAGLNDAFGYHKKFNGYYVN